MRFVLLQEGPFGLELAEGQGHHLDVMRLPNRLFLPGLLGLKRFDLEIQKSGKGQWRVVQAHLAEVYEEPQAPVYLVPLIEPSRLEFAIEKLVELGAAQICLYHSDHTSWPKKKVAAFCQKMDKARAWVLQAAQQSARMPLSRIDAPICLDDLIQRYRSECLALVVGTEKPLTPKEMSLASVVLIGPEGDFSEREIDLMREAGVQMGALHGRHILRSETALLYMASLYNASRSL